MCEGKGQYGVYTLQVDLWGLFTSFEWLGLILLCVCEGVCNREGTFMYKVQVKFKVIFYFCPYKRAGLDNSVRVPVCVHACVHACVCTVGVGVVALTVSATMPISHKH